VNRAPTLSGGESYYTEYRSVLFDAGRMVLLGSSVDDTTSIGDFDGVVTRMQSDPVFADGFDD